ncbi:hypothetical protein [Marivita sp.]|uniref:hypothetical protein n=1 Tax=Marivita sp. TaxID=2003365 RepID=UPI003F6D4638
MSVFDTTSLSSAGVKKTGSITDAVQTRANIFAMTQAAEDAVLRPKECGAFPHDLRAAIAARIAAQAGDAVLATRYAQVAGARTHISDPAQDGGSEDSVLVTFVDKTANATREIEAEDIARLKATGISDADIVRICELVAFVAYQVRVVAGLRLMQGGNQ